MSRAERGEKTREALFRAAAEIVGEVGYRDASVARIAERANVASGTFYNYFRSRQDLFDQLLPALGERMLDHIAQRVDPNAAGAERERQRLTAYFDFLEETPGFYRILYEAETLAPEAHRSHIALVAKGYERALGRARERGEVEGFSADELEAVAFMLIAIRGYLSMRYGGAGGGKVPRAVVDTYVKLISHGLFRT